jgi:phosphomannomutase
MQHALMVSISGIRGIFGRGLDPGVLVRYASAFGAWCHERGNSDHPVVVVGRDARVTGPLCSQIVRGTLRAVGCTVVDAGLATTPTVEMAVLATGAAGGIVLSASHNPAEWNALKLLNGRGEFLSPDEGREVIARAERGRTPTVEWDRVGGERAEDFLGLHMDAVLGLGFVDPGRIAERDFRVVVDGINSVGGIALPALLERLGVRPDRIVRVNCEPTGRFAHEAEPLPENLAGTIRVVKESGADLGLVVDPDADRLALIADGGVYVTEELTQVIAADFLWRFRPGPFATNLSSSRAIDDVARRHGQVVHRSPVGEINVVRKMQEVGAVLGGEGNGGVILPDLHYGRDALVGAAMVLQHLANEDLRLSELRASLPEYHIVKQKVGIGDLDPDVLLARVADRHASERISTEDGVKIDFDEGWVHLRRSNTEPIVRVYSEAADRETAEALGQRFMAELLELGQIL